MELSVGFIFKLHIRAVLLNHKLTQRRDLFAYSEDEENRLVEQWLYARRLGFVILHMYLI